MMQEPPPPHVTEALAASALAGSVVLTNCRADLDDEGRRADLWLFATQKELLVVGAGSAHIIGSPGAEQGESEPVARVLKKYPLGQVERFRTAARIGAGVLQAHIDGVWIDIVRFSNQRAAQFQHWSQQLDRLCRNQEFDLLDEEGDAARVCSNCGVSLRFAGEPCPRCVPSERIWRRVFQLLHPYRALTGVMLGLSLAAVALELIPPLLQRVLVDDVLQATGPDLDLPRLVWVLLWLVIGLAVVRLVAAVLAVAKGRVSSRVGTALTSDLRTQLVKKLQEQSIAYHDRNHVGMLMSRVIYDTEAMHTLMHQVTGGFILQVLQLLGIGGMLFYLNPKLALVTLLPMPFVLLGSWFFTKYLFPRHHRYWDSVGRQASALTGMLSGIRVVKAFSQEDREQARFETSSRRLRDARLTVDLSTATFSSLIGFVSGLGALFVWYVGGRGVLLHDMTLGSLMAFLAYLAMFYAPLGTLSESTTFLSNFLAASQRIFELLDAPAQVQEPKHPQPLDHFRGQIRFQRVSFAYEENRPVLKNLNFEIHPGEMIGVVGRSGSGKSTLVSLITRFYDVSAGSITLDGIDVRQISSRELRRKIGMVLQEPFLFEGTVADNITYGNSEAGAERILRAARAANSHDFVMRMPFAYETVLGERGAGLSGGERQRLSIARALLYEPQVLILDEATSSVDTESERAIQEAIRRFAQHRTVIAIAHRLSTLKDADRLLVFDQGQLVEQGTPDELLQKNGVYASLVHIQSSFHRATRLLQTVGAGAGADTPPADAEDDDEPAWESHESAPPPEETWLTPDAGQFQAGPYGELRLVLAGQLHRGVYVLRAFPATSVDEFLSIQVHDELAGDREIAFIRRLADWPEETQVLLRQSLAPRYLLRIVQSLDGLSLERGFLSCRVATDEGPLQFLMQASRDGMKPYGKAGRLLIDVDENHYLIPDLDQLPSAQQWLLQLHFAE